MTYYVGNMPVGEDELMHYGIKGMRWGQRRYQNRDGSLTAAGRLKYGYGQARKGASSWYKKNKKTIGRAATVVGTAGALAVAGRLGWKNRAALKNAGRAFSKAAGRAGRTAGGTLRSAKNVIGANTSAKLAQSRRAREIRNSVADVRRNLNRSAKSAYKNYGIVNNKYLRKGDKFIVDSGNKARKAGQGVKNTAHNVKVKASVASQKAKLGKAQSKIYKQTGIVGSQMGKGRKAMADASMKVSKTAKSVANAPKKAANAVKRKSDVRNVKKAGEEMDFLRRRSAARKASKDLVKGSTADVVRLKGRKAADKVAGAARNTGSKVKNTVRNAGQNAKRKKANTHYLFRTSGKQKAANFAKGMAIGAAPIALGTAGQAAYDRYGKNPKLKSNGWKRRHKYSSRRK